MNSEFSVYWFDATGDYYTEARFVDAETAVNLARSLTERGPALALGIIRRVIVTDGDDYTCFEWKHGSGVTFPLEGSA